MGSLELETDSLDSDTYLTLGIKESGKGVFGAPRILSILSSLLEQSIQKNEILLETTQDKGTATFFHGLRVPPISIQKYIDRIFKYAGCSPSCFVFAYIYVDRYLQKTNFHLTSLNVHWLLITSVMVAAKFIDDVFFNNAYYARIGGISTAELNRLEVKFLFSLDFRLQVSAKTFQIYCTQLQKEAAEGHQIERPIKACGIKESRSNQGDTTAARAPTSAR